MESESTLFEQPKTKINISLVNRDATYFDKILPGLTKRQSEVLAAVKAYQPCTMHDVSDVLNKPLNTISGRFGELVKKNRIEVVGRKDRKSIYKVAG